MGLDRPSASDNSDTGRRHSLESLRALLAGEQLPALQRVCREISARLPELVDVWRDLYVESMGPARSLPPAEFERLCGAQLRTELEAIAAGDAGAVSRSVEELGRRLAVLNVPFAEVIAIKLLLSRAIEQILRVERESGPPPPVEQARVLLDRFVHLRTLLMASVYFRAHTGSLRSAISLLEEDARGFDPGALRRSVFHGIVGASASMRALYRKIAAAAKGRGTALVVGETGTGKELVARALHRAGDPPTSPFVAVNCAALPKDLIESELFGHEAGSFTGARGRFKGLLRAADGGTLFLDEITEMDRGSQAKLLRVLQERRVRAVGSLEEHPVDVRLVASTNYDPVQAVAEHKLREDLYYRLKVHTLRVPPLRERKDDIPMLARHFVRVLSGRYDSTVEAIDDEALEALCEYEWPGNVRELMGVIEAAISTADGGVIGRDNLPLEEMVPPDLSANRMGDAVVTFEDAERTLIRRALERSGGNKTEAARILGISRKQLYVRLGRYGLDS